MSGPLQELARAARRWPLLQEACKAPAEAQQRVWQETQALLDQGSFWRERHGGNAPPLEQHTLTTYADYADAIEASWQSGINQLTGEPVTLWARSSGSSGKAKRYPWTASFIAQHREGSDLTLPVFEAVARRKGRGPLLSLVATSPHRLSPTGIRVGYATTLLAPDANPIYPRVLDYSKEAFDTWMPLYAAAADLGGVRAVSCDHVLLLVQQIEANRDRILSLLHGDTPMGTDLALPSTSEARLAHLDAVLRSPDPLTVATLWPRLRIINTWRAATGGLQAQMLLATAPEGCQLIDYPYGACEGPVATPIDPDAVGGPIHPGAALHEFLELGAEGRPDQVLKAWDLEVGRRYEVLLTTKMGFVRNRLGDVVECTGRFHATPTLRFHGRADREISLGVVTFSEAELTEALAKVQRPQGVGTVFGPSEDGLALVLYTTEALPDEAVDRVHQHVRSVNDSYHDYEATGRTARIRQQVLPHDHPLWAFCEPAHAQSKPRFLVDEAPSRFLPGAGGRP